MSSKNMNNCQITEVQPQGVRVLLSTCLIFYQFQPCVAYKSVAYKKKSMYTCIELDFSTKLSVHCNGITTITVCHVTSIITALVIK